ncbi:hypothetical protein D3C79_661840 [compost metagenome]
MRVLAGVVDLEALHGALLVQAAHGHRQAVARLAVVEGLRGHAAGLQLAMTAPLGDRVGGFGDRGAVEADLRLLGEHVEQGGVVADDQRVGFSTVLEEVKQPCFIQQALDEVEVAFAVLGDVGVALVHTTQAQRIGNVAWIQGENVSEHLCDRAVLEDARVGAVNEHRQPRAQDRTVAVQGAIATQTGKAGEVAVDEARRGIGQFDLDAHLLADHRLER